MSPRLRWCNPTARLWLATAFLVVGSLCMPRLAWSAEADGFSSWATLRDAGVVRQKRDFSCGVAALATYLTYYLRHPVTEEALLTLLDQHGDDWALPEDWREQGVSYAVLQRLAQHHGLRGAGMVVTPALLQSLTVPAIVRLEVNGLAHFSLIRGIDPSGWVQLADPSWGNHRMNLHAFMSLWADPRRPGDAGTLMVFQPAPASQLRPDNTWFGVDQRQSLLRPPA